MAVELLLYRVYGEPKISKPPILKNLKPVFQQTLNKSKRKCNIFIIDESVIVYFFDLFSKDMKFPDQKDAGLPTSVLIEKYPEKFIGKKMKNRFCYSDAWCPVFERNEGYVIFKNLISDIKGLHWISQSVFFDIIPRLTEEFMSLSYRNSSFEAIEVGGGQRAADYVRFVNDMVLKIYQMIKDSKL